MVKKLIKKIDHLITLAKKNILSSKREVQKILRNKKKNGVKAIDKLFNVLGPCFKEHKGD